MEGPYGGDFSTFHRIAHQVPNDGSFKWTIPSSLSLKNEYRIKICSWDYGQKCSSRKFTIFNVDQELKMTSPNGGERWQKGRPYTITWRPGNGGKYVSLTLRRGIETHFITSGKIANSGSHVWEVPHLLSAGSGYRVEVRSGADPDIRDLSDNPFRVELGDIKKLRVISPNGGEIWHPGYVYKIRWDRGNWPSYVRIYLYQGDKFVQPITLKTPNTGEFDWRLRTRSGQDYTIMLETAVDGYGNRDHSDSTFVIGGRERPIKILVPKKNGVWLNDNYNRIRWNKGDGLGRVNIYLCRNDGSCTIIGSKPRNAEFHGWKPPPDIKDGQYTIKVALDGQPNIIAQVGPIRIQGAANLELTRPHGSKKPLFTYGEFLITWKKGNGGRTIKIDLVGSVLKAGTLVGARHEITPGTINSGEFIWKIPPSVGTGDYKVQIKSVSNQYVHDQSRKSFPIKWIPEKIKIRSPSAGDHLEKNKFYTISWYRGKEHPTYMNIYLYKDGKRLWALAKRVNCWNGQYGSWDIRDRSGRGYLTPGDGYQIKVESAYNRDNYDMSGRVVRCDGQ